MAVDVVEVVLIVAIVGVDAKGDDVVVGVVVIVLGIVVVVVVVVDEVEVGCCVTAGVVVVLIVVVVDDEVENDGDVTLSGVVVSTAGCDGGSEIGLFPSFSVATGNNVVTAAAAGDVVVVDIALRFAVGLVSRGALV